MDHTKNEKRERERDCPLCSEDTAQSLDCGDRRSDAFF